MTERIKEAALYEDLAGVPDDKIAEIIEGDLYVSPRPAPRHANATSTLGADLHDAFQRGRRGPGGWWILDEPELHLGADVLVPDIGGWRHERMPELPELPWFEIPPDWLCEVISPSSERIDRQAKLPIYARAAIQFLWIVDPSLRTLEVLARKDGGWRLVSAHSGDTVICEPPFEAVSIELAPLWSRARPASA
ncbi:MAG TPA: Uma2 family endonuclease [Thermoanaerobaculia bacterium]|nr:Uma2 family endonuclease [Thermoanaerobaculia bacterium]